MEIVVKYLAAWAWRKARHIAAREVDAALDEGVSGLRELVADGVGPDSTAGAACITPSDVGSTASYESSECVCFISGNGNYNAVNGSSIRITKSRGVAIIAVMLILAAVAAAGWYYVPRSLYQRQALVTCQRMNEITSMNHAEIVWLDTESLDSNANQFPDLLSIVRIRKKMYMYAANGLLDQLVASFAEFDQVQTPSSQPSVLNLASNARLAFDSYTERLRRDIDFAKLHLKDNMSVLQANKVGIAFGEPARLRIRLNGAMAKLAGQECSAIATEVRSA